MVRRIVFVFFALTLIASPALAQELRGGPHSRLGSGLAWTQDGRLAVSAPGDGSVLLVDPAELPPESTLGETPLVVLRVPELDPTGQLAALHLHDETLLAVLRAPAHGEAVIDFLRLRGLSEEREYAEQVAASLWIDDLPTFCGGDREPPCLILRSAPDLDGDGLPDLALGRPDLGQRIFVSLPPLDGQTHDALLLEIDAVEATDDELRLPDPVYAESAAARAVGMPDMYDGAGVVRVEPMSHADGQADGHSDEEYPDHHPVGDPNAPNTYDFDPIANVLGLSDWELASANPGATTVTSLPTSSSATHTLDGDSVAELLGAAAGAEIVIDGRFTHSVPLDVPFGRGAVAPSLAITYAGGRFDPWLAHHWTLSGFPQIERHGPLGGAPTGDEALDTFRADGQLLIKEPLQSGSVRSFRTEQATPRWYSFDSSTDLWTVTGGGVTVTVGADGPHGAVEVGPSTSGLEVAHRWWIASEADDVGNDVVFFYDTGDIVRPLRVAWGTSHVGAPAPGSSAWHRNFALSFVWDGPALGDVRATAGRFALDLNALSSIDLSGSADPTSEPMRRLRSWEFAYTELRPTDRPAIESISLRGAPDAANPAGLSLPIRTFHYEEDDGALVLGGVEPALFETTTGQFVHFDDPSLGGDGQVIQLVRLNHDALPDVLVFDIHADWEHWKTPVCKEDGCPAPSGNGNAACSEPSTVVCLDPTRSGWGPVCDYPVEVRAFVNRGDLQFTEDQWTGNFLAAWVNDQGSPRSGLDDVLGRVRFADVNGDGMDDLLGPDSSYLSISNADWQSPPPAQPGVRGIGAAQLVDVNGDGRPELLFPPSDRSEDVPANEWNAGGLCVVPPRDGAGYGEHDHPIWTVAWNRSEAQTLAFTEAEPFDGMPFFGGWFTDGVNDAAMDMVVAPLPSGQVSTRVSCTANGADGTLFGTGVLSTLNHDVTGLFAAGSGWTWLAQHQRFADVNADGCVDVTLSMDATPLLLNGVNDNGPGPKGLELLLRPDDSVSEVFYGDCVGGFVPAAKGSGWSEDLGWPSLRIRQSVGASKTTSCANLPFNGLRLSVSCDDEHMVQPWAHWRCEQDPQTICCSGNQSRECSGMYAVCEYYSCSAGAYGGDGNGPGWGAWSPETQGWLAEPHPTFNYERYSSVEPWDPQLRHLWELGVEERRPGPTATSTPGGAYQDVDGDGVPELLQVCVAKDAPDPVGNDPAPGTEAPKNIVASYPLVAYTRRGFWDNGVREGAACEDAHAADLGDVTWIGQLTDRGEFNAGFPDSRMENRASRLGPDRASMLIDLDGDGFADHVQIDAGVWRIRRNTRVVGAGTLRQIEYPTGGRSTLVFRAGDPLANPLLPRAERGIVEIIDGQGHRVFGRAGCRIAGGCQTTVEQTHRGAVFQTRSATRAEAPGQNWLSATWTADGHLESIGVALRADADRLGIDPDAPYTHPAWRSCAVTFGEGSHGPSLLSPQHWCMAAPNDAISGPASGMAHHHDLVGQQVFAFPDHAGLLGANIAVPGFQQETSGPPAETRIRILEQDTAGEPWLQTETTWARGDVTRADDDLRTESVWSSVPGQGPRLMETWTVAPATGLLANHQVTTFSGFTPTGSTRLDAVGNTIVTTSTLDTFGRIDSVTNPDGDTTQYGYGWCGGIESTLDAIGNTRSNPSDSYCRATGGTSSNGLIVTRTHGARGPETTWTFPDAGQPPLLEASFRDNDSSHVGDPLFPQGAESDGRTASFRWIDVRGQGTRSAHCSLGGPLPAPSVATPADVLALCAPGSRVQSDTIWSADGLRVAKSAPYSPTLLGGVTVPYAQVWGRTTYDSLSRPTTTATVRGLGSAMASGAGFATLSATQHVRFVDGAGAIGPDGILRRTVVEPLEERVVRGVQVVARSERRADGVMLHAFDAGGRMTSWTHDGFGRVETTTGPGWLGVDSGVITPVQPTVSVLRLPSGEVADTTDPLGFIWSMGRDGLGRPTTSTDPLGNVIERVFDDPLRQTTLIQLDHDDVVVHTDALGRPVLRELGEGLTEAAQYDSWGGVLSATDAAGITTSESIAFLSGGITRRATSTPSGTSYGFVGPDGRVLRQVDPDGVAVDTEYDEWGRPVITRLGPTNPLDIATWPSGHVLVEVGYDALSRPAWSCPGGRYGGERCTATTFDAVGRPVASYDGVAAADVVFPSAGSYRGVTTYAYRADDRLETITDPLGRLTELVYDAAGHVHEVWVASVLQSRTWYDAMGRPARTEDALGQVTTSTFDPRGLVAALDVPGLPTQTFGYRADGQLEWTENGDGWSQTTNGIANDSWFSYDGLGRATGTEHVQGLTTSTLYAGAFVAAQELQDIAGGLQQRTETLFDASGRPERVISAITETCAALGQGMAGTVLQELCDPEDVSVVELGWTAAGRRDALTDPNGNTTSWGYEPRTGRLRSVLTATTEQSLRWDPLGRLDFTERGPLGGVPEVMLSHRYDIWGQLERQEWVSAGSVEEVQYAYDVVGRQIWTESRRDGQPIVEEHTDWDDWDRPVQVGRNLFANPTVNPTNGQCDPGEICLTYDDLGRPEGLVYPDGRDVQLRWSAQGLDRACSGAGCASQDPLYEVAQRNVLGQPTEEWLSGGVLRMTTYDTDGRPETVDTDFATDSITVDQKFDALGRLTSRSTQQIGALALGDVGGTEAWEYNAAGWLVSEAIDDEVFTQTFDAGGNRLGRVDTAGQGWRATYGADNRLDSWDAGSGTTVFGYDGLGRRLNDLGGTTYAYTPRGRVERAFVGGAQVASYAYGPDGRRAWEATANGTRDYVYGPASWLPYVVNTPAGPEDQVLVAGAMLGVLGDPGAGNPAGAGSSAVLDDGTGTPLFRSGVGGALDSQSRWDAYGTPITSGGAPMSSSWKQLLPSGPDVGLLAAGVRDYDPATGTWMQADPMGVDGGLNLYRYAEGDPVNSADPSGYCIGATTPDWLLEQQREQAEWDMQGRTDWNMHKGGPPPEAPRGMPNYCQMATDGTLIDCGGTNESRDYFMAAADRAYANRKLAEAQWDAASALLASDHSKDEWMKMSASSRAAAMQPAFELVAYLKAVDHQVSWTARYGALTSAAYFSFPERHPDPVDPRALSDFLAQNPGAMAGPTMVARVRGTVTFHDPLVVTGRVPYGNAPQLPTEVDTFLARNGGPDLNLLDLGTLRAGGRVGIRFVRETEIRGFDADMARAIAVREGDLPMPTTFDGTLMKNMAQIHEWDRNGGDYDTATLVGGTAGGVVVVGVQTAGDFAELSPLGPLVGIATDLAVRWLQEEIFRLTSMPPEDQIVAGMVVTEVGGGFLGLAFEIAAGMRLLQRARGMDRLSSFLDAGGEVHHSPTSTRLGSDAVSARVQGNLAPADGYHDLIVHGNPHDDLGSLAYVDGLPHHTDQVAAAIRANPDYNGEPIRMVVCYGAHGGCTSMGADLSRSLGVEVVGATHPVGVAQAAGSTPEAMSPGFWLRFEPGGHRFMDATWPIEIP